jgi:hypothetical protein
MFLVIVRGISWIGFDFRAYLMGQAGEENLTRTRPNLEIDCWMGGTSVKIVR